MKRKRERPQFLNITKGEPPVECILAAQLCLLGFTPVEIRAAIEARRARIEREGGEKRAA